MQIVLENTNFVFFHAVIPKCDGKCMCSYKLVELCVLWDSCHLKFWPVMPNIVTSIGIMLFSSEDLGNSVFSLRVHMIFHIYLLSINYILKKNTCIIIRAGLRRVACCSKLPCLVTCLLLSRLFLSYCG